MKKYKDLFKLFAGFLIVSCLALLGVYLLNGRNELDLTKVQSPTSYKELYDVLKFQVETNDDGFLVDEEIAPGVAVDKSSGDYSKTNIQVAGVDEADIVKTDGNYIYALSNDYLYIIEAKDGVMTIASKIKSQESIENGSSSYQEIYIKDNKLIVIKNSYKFPTYYHTTGEKSSSLYLGDEQEVSVVIFDVTNKSKPSKINELSQSGNYVSSRLVDNYLYVTTNYSIYDEFVQNNLSTYIPTLRTKEARSIEIKDIIIAPNPTSNSYLVVTGIDINSSSDFKSSKAVLGSSSNIYADTDSLYIAGYGNEKVGNTYVSKTNLIKFSMNQGKLNLEATGFVNGNILNQFSMDEYNGYFRIVTTSDDHKVFGIDEIISSNEVEDTTKNNLYVLDKDLKLVSKIEGLAAGERIYSVRFDSEVAYFVTFKQVDPLFVVDLSNPNTPVLKSELKIPGFSEYLHVFNDQYLFGLGKEADAEGRVTGLKISMYDIQNKSDVIEKYKLIIGDENSWTEASYNHKAILVSSTKNLIAFPMDDKYVLYKFTDNVGFEKIGEIDYSSTNETYYYYFGNMRGLYIDDYMYVINQYQIRTLNLKTLENGNILELSSQNELEINVEKPIY